MPEEKRSATGRFERRNHELSVLNATARELNRSVRLHEALEFTLSQVAELLELETGWIWLLDEPSGEPYLAATRNLPPGLASDPRRMDGSSYCYCLDTYRRGDLDGAANVNVLACSRLADLVGGTGGLSYHASIPLYAGAKKLGVMNVASPSWRSLSEDELRLLYTIGDLLAIAVERSRLFDRSTHLGMMEERNRLAREIHDTIAQTLSATALQLESAEALLEEDPCSPRVREALGRALSLTRQNLQEARRSVQDLRAAPLESHQLAQALRVLVDGWEQESMVSARLKTINGASPLPPRVEVALYRICQEALSNVARHARANRATVRLVITPERALLSVEDDGAGFDPCDVPEGHYGLVGMRERAASVGGSLEVESALGEGTRVRVRVPLREG